MDTYLVINKCQLLVYVADSLEKQMEGFRGRKELPENEGMLFVYEKNQHLHFWMKDTPISLSLAFIDSNKIITEIIDLKPFDETIHKSMYKNKYALEVNRGWFEKNKIRVGMGVLW